ncbi:gamma-aminobutyric acid receptor subunit beta-3-like [Branchiostoma floridae x Branchiostoma japonicum]
MEGSNNEGMEAKLEGIVAEVKNINCEVKRINRYLERSSGQKWYSRRPFGKTRVLINTTLFSLRDVDTVKQEFSAELWFETFYKDSHLKGLKDRDEVDWDNQWDPWIELRNTVTIEKDVTRQSLIPVVGREVPIVHAFRMVRATFKADMDLTDFPFDHQKLTIKLMSGWSTKRVELRKNLGCIDNITGDDFTDGEQWELSEYLECKHDVKDIKQSKTSGEYPLYTITAHVQRKTGFYMWNIVLILFIITALSSVSSFSVPVEQHSDRLVITFTLLLTTVAFKLVVSHYLPTVPYLTLLDRYVLACIIFQSLVALEKILASFIGSCIDKYNAWLIDKIFLGIFVFALLCVHVYFRKVVVGTMNKTKGKMQRIEEEFKRVKGRTDEAYERRDKTQQGSTDTNLIITGFTYKEVQQFESWRPGDETNPLMEMETLI